MSLVELPHGMMAFPEGWKIEPVRRDMYLVGLYTQEGPWEVVGLFTTMDLAIAECVTDMHFIGAITPDLPSRKPRKTWPRTWYPLAEDRPEWAR